MPGSRPVSPEASGTVIGDGFAKDDATLGTLKDESAAETRDEYIEILEMEQEEAELHEPHRWALADLMGKREVSELGRRVENALYDVLERTPHFDDLELPENIEKGVPEDRRTPPEDDGMEEFDPAGGGVPCPAAPRRASRRAGRARLVREKIGRAKTPHRRSPWSPRRPSVWAPATS